jgi:hypothetical protein
VENTTARHLCRGGFFLVRYIVCDNVRIPFWLLRVVTCSFQFSIFTFQFPFPPFFAKMLHKKVPFLAHVKKSNTLARRLWNFEKNEKIIIT